MRVIKILGLFVLFILEAIIIMGPLYSRLFPKFSARHRIISAILVLVWFAVVLLLLAAIVVYICCWIGGVAIPII